MDRQVYSYRDESLNAGTAAAGALRVLAGTDGISLLASGPDGKVLALESIELHERKNRNQYAVSTIEEYLNGHALLQMRFGKVIAAISSPQATLVPKRLFSPDECQQYFKLLSPPQNGAIYGHETVSPFDCELVWSADATFRNFADAYGAQHLASGLIRHFHRHAPSNELAIFLNLRDQSAQILVFDHGSLLFYNSFDWIKPVDLLYFVLLGYDQFKLNPQQTPLHATGQLLPDTESYKILFKYIGQIRFLSPSGAASLPAGDQLPPAHYWFDLLSIGDL